MMETSQEALVEARIAEEEAACKKPQASGDRDSLPSPEAVIRLITEGLTKESPKAEILSRLTMFTAPLAKLTNLTLGAVLEGLKTELGLRDKDLKALEKDITQARKSKSGRGAPPTVEDLEEIRRLHPAVDIRNGYMTLGFRVNLSGGEIGYLLLISDGKKVRAEINPETVELGDQVYEVPAGAGVPFLEDAWSLKQVKAVLDDPTIDSATLWHELKAALRKYVDLPEPVIGLIAAWIIMTYFSLLFAAVVFLHIIGIKECGKSKTLESMGCLSFNPWKGKHITAPALGDTMEGMRGTMLIDQAEKLAEELVGLLADSYKKAGGKRRIVDTSNGRAVLEFSTYGPKTFASTKELDPDLKDRCARIPITRTRKPLPDLEGYEPIWANLKDQLYRFALTHFAAVGLAYERIAGNGTRVRELWRPIGAVLWALGVGEEEVDSIFRFFQESVQSTRHEPTAWESRLLEVLQEEAERQSQPFELTPEKIVALMDIDGEKQPSPRWVGDILSRYHLFELRKRPKIKVDGKEKRQTIYQFIPARLKELCAIYLREPPPNHLSHLSSDENTNNSNLFGGTEEKVGTRPRLSPLDLKDQGHVGSCPTKITCPPYPADNTSQNLLGHEGQENQGGVTEKISTFFSGEEVEI